MNLADYLSKARGRQASLAKAIGAHAPDVSRWADGKRPVPFDYGAAIELATGGEVTRKELFPDDWSRLWPELVDDGQRRAPDSGPTPLQCGSQPTALRHTPDAANDRAVTTPPHGDNA